MVCFHFKVGSLVALGFQGLWCVCQGTPKLTLWHHDYERVSNIAGWQVTCTKHTGDVFSTGGRCRHFLGRQLVCGVWSLPAAIRCNHVSIVVIKISWDYTNISGCSIRTLTIIINNYIFFNRESIYLWFPGHTVYTTCFYTLAVKHFCTSQVFTTFPFIL